MSARTKIIIGGNLLFLAALLFAMGLWDWIGAAAGQADIPAPPRTVNCFIAAALIGPVGGILMLIGALAWERSARNDD